MLRSSLISLEVTNARAAEFVKSDVLRRSSLLDAGESVTGCLLEELETTCGLLLLMDVGSGELRLSNSCNLKDLRVGLVNHCCVLQDSSGLMNKRCLLRWVVNGTTLALALNRLVDEVLKLFSYWVKLNGNLLRQRLIDLLATSLILCLRLLILRGTLGFYVFINGDLLDYLDFTIVLDTLFDALFLSFNAYFSLIGINLKLADLASLNVNY